VCIFLLHGFSLLTNSVAFVSLEDTRAFLRLFFLRLSFGISAASSIFTTSRSGVKIYGIHVLGFENGFVPSYSLLVYIACIVAVCPCCHMAANLGVWTQLHLYFRFIFSSRVYPKCAVTLRSFLPSTELMWWHDSSGIPNRLSGSAPLYF
jgi:hypothetical protein